MMMLLFSCMENQEKTTSENFITNKFKIKGQLSYYDSVKKNKIVLAGKPKKIEAGKPFRMLRNSNTFPVGLSVIVENVNPHITFPGKHPYSSPLKYDLVGTKILSGNPEIVSAKEAHIMENSPKNLSSFGKLQGLKSNIVYDITQDIYGNIWFGTEGGLTKYDGTFFSHYTIKQGLSHNIVLSILIDKKKNIWVGTKGGGISKFDGKNFTNYSENILFAKKFVTSILEDKKGNIWFGTNGGAIQYNWETFLYYTESQGLINNSILSLYEDKHGNIWFGTEKGVSKFDGFTFSNFTKKEGLEDEFVLSINQDKNFDFWFGTKSGVLKYDGKSFFQLKGDRILNHTTITSVLNDNSGNIWYGTWQNGLYKYDLQNNVSHFTEEQGLINNNINCIFQDNNGIMWFGTNSGGMVRYYGDYFNHYTSKQGLDRGHIQCMTKDRLGNVWLGTWGGGIYKFEDKEIVHFDTKIGLINNDVRSLLEDKDGNLWIGTWKGVSKFDGKFFTEYTEKEGLPHNVIVSMLQDHQGNIWFSTEGKGVTKFDGKYFTNYNNESGLNGNTVKSMIQDKKGNIWFATENGITKFEPRKNSTIFPGTFIHFSEIEGLPSNNISSIIEDNFGNVWFGSLGEGIFKYDGIYFETFSKDDGLFNNDVMSLLADSKGNIWIGTRTSISKLESKSTASQTERVDKLSKKDKLIIKNYKFEDGFFGIGCNTNSICENKNNEIWIGANDRLTILNNDELESVKNAPNVKLIDIKLFNEKIPWTSLENNIDSNIILRNGVIINNIHFDGLTNWYNIPKRLSLPHYNNFITFNFIGISTKSPQDIRYIYKLDGLDNQWSNPTSITSASYGNLNNGNYIFRIKAVNNEGYWSNELSYSFTIRPPLWKTNLAYFFYFLIFVIGVVLVDRIQTSRVIKKEREKTRDRELEQAREIEKANKNLKLQIDIVEEQKIEIEKQRLVSDKLLLNILPSEVAEELKIKGYSEVKSIKDATVLFADFIEFTKLSEIFSPKDLVDEIHECFSTFDHIMNKFNIEKIKTVGDSYIAAGGLLLPHFDSALNTVKAGIEMQKYIIQRKEERQKLGLIYFDMRIGIHTGPLVAGIVGVNKFQYDIWGDTVNTANRVESCGESGKVNISGTTYERIKKYFQCTYRGKIAAKGKGEVDMYFVENELKSSV